MADEELRFVQIAVATTVHSTGQMMHLIGLTKDGIDYEWVAQAGRYGWKPYPTNEFK